jgi:non-ribosomal peptide synthetase component F
MALHSARRDTCTDLLHGAFDMLPTVAWLEDDRRPLDWNGPVNRPFTRFYDQDLQRPIIEHFERVASRQRGAIAIREADTALSFGELWDGVSGLAETLAAETRPGDLIGILLPACPMFPLAMLACFASGHPFVALDTHCPADWLDHVLRDARPTLLVTLEDGLRGVEARMPWLRVVRLTGLPRPARTGWRPATMDVDEPAPARGAIDQRCAHQPCGPIADARFAVHNRGRPRHHDRTAGRSKYSPPRSARRRRP